MPASLFEGFLKVKVNTLSITSTVSKKTIDIRQICPKIEIFTSMFQPTTTATLMLNDASSLIQNLPLLGEETVTISFESPGRKAFSKNFWVHKITNANFDDNGANITYILHLVSVDQHRAISVPVLQGFSDTISNMVSGILQNKVQTKQTLDLEATKGIQNLVIPHWDCWQAIEFLRHRAVSVNYNSPFIFFEDQNGYHFKSYEQLIKERLSGEVVTFTNNSYTGAVTQDQQNLASIPDQYRNVTLLDVPSKAKSAALINEGGVTSRTTVFDVLNKSIRNIDNTILDATSIIKQPLANSFNQTHTSALANTNPIPTVLKFMPLDSTNVDESVNHYGAKNLYVQMLKENEIAFTACGDSQLQPGDIFNMQMPKRVNNDLPDPQLSGKYLIGTMKHDINVNQMMTTIEGYRSGFDTKILA